jgi:hypothetical protein
MHPETKKWINEIMGEICQKLSEKAPDEMEVGEIYQNGLNFQRSIQWQKYQKVEVEVQARRVPVRRK